MPSTHQRSGRFESCNSMRSSPVAVSTSFTSPFTSSSQMSNSLSVAWWPISRSRSSRRMEMVGIGGCLELHALRADHFQIGREKIANVMDLQRDLRHPIQSKTPSNDRHVHAEWQR